MRQRGAKSTLGEINCRGLRQLHAAAPTTTAPMAITYVATAAMQRVNADPIPAWCSSDGSVHAGTAADGRCIRDLAVSGYAWSRTQEMPKERRLQKHQPWPSTGHQHPWGSNNPSTPTAHLTVGLLPKPITKSTHASPSLQECSKYIQEFLERTRRVAIKRKKSVLEMSFCVVWLAFKGSDHFNTVGIKLFC